MGPFRRYRGAAIEQFFNKLSEGDPVAIAMAVGFGLLIAFALGVAIYDRKKRKAEERKGRGDKFRP